MQTLMLGLDAFDPGIFERLAELGRLPNLTKYAEANGYARLAIANPPQSEVSWTNIATGLNPGGHGLFDFVHRNPSNYTLSLSLLPTRQGITGTQFVPPYSASTVFDEAVRQGFPATVLWWPATFPARPQSPVRTLPGLGTPDIQGRLGVGVLFTNNADLLCKERKTSVVTLKHCGKGRYAGTLSGPTRKTRRGLKESTIELQLEVNSDQSARLIVGNHLLELTEGRWSPIVELAFKVGRFLSVRALTRIILSQLNPAIKLYFLPLQIHPMHSPWRYASPPSFVRRMWNACGPFLTLGWPQDTTALEDECVTDNQFLELCQSIDLAREAVLMYQLQHFHEGILASVFDSLDRIQHMFLRDRPDIVEKWYVKLDELVGRVKDYLSQAGRNPARILILSDHGFSGFNYKVHLNRWLVEQGYLVPKKNGEPGSLKGADWPQSQAYAVGLNSVYLNLLGREGQGCVRVDQRDRIIRTLRQDLTAWRGPDGRPVIQRVWSQEEAFTGPLSTSGPDLVVGFSSGYRASAQTGLGMWPEQNIELNRDHWGADHCIDPQSVPGVLFSDQDLSHLRNPSYQDVPALAIGVQPRQDGSTSAPPPQSESEDEEIVEERLRSLGYL